MKLIDNPKYETLSYGWGEPIFSERLYLPHGYLRITSNLAAGLRRVRHHDRSRKLWVDAVCSNQNEGGEKSAQVGRMSKIYSKTECGLCWLGEGNGSTAAAVSLIKEAAELAPELGLDPTLEDFSLDFSRTPKLSEKIIHFTEQLDMVVLSTFLSQDWFQRLVSREQLHTF